MLTVEGLRAGYGRRNAINIEKLECHDDGVTVLLGPNGSGKSTLMRCLTGVLRPIAGQITLNNRDLTSVKSAQRARMLAYVPQEAQFPFTFTVGELVQLGAEASGLKRAEAETRIQEALQLFELEVLTGKSLPALSGGERQRAALARAFAQGAGMLLLDEPTAHLDLRYQLILRDALRKASKEERRGSIVVLHDLNLAAAFADTVVLLDKGEIAGVGSPENILTEENIRRVYHTDVKIFDDQNSGGRWITPKSPSA